METDEIYSYIGSKKLAGYRLLLINIENNLLILTSANERQNQPIKTAR